MCKYRANNAEKCWYDHSDGDLTLKSVTETNEYTCRTCQEKLISKSQVLSHR